MKTKITTFIALAIVFSSCKSQKLHTANVYPLTKFNDVQKSADITTYDASKRGSFVYVDYNENKIQLLAEPPADAIVSALSELNAKIDIKGQVSAEAASSYLESITKLSASSVSNTLLRDALYRLNEMQFNKWKFEGNYKDGFDNILKLVKDVAELELQKVKLETKEKEAEILNSEKEILKVKNPNINLDLVRQTEKEGFEAILNNDLNIAIQKFQEVEKLYPTYHQAYELSIYLKKIKNEDKKIDKEVKNQILKNYSWGMPEEIKKLLIM